jgi:hypothetical protein
VLVSLMSTVALSAGLVAAPSAASAVDTTPTVQLVMSHVRFVSYVGVPEVAPATNLAFDTSVTAQQPYDDVRDEGEESGSRVPLTRSYPRNEFGDANFIHAAQFSYSSNTFQWSTRMTPAWQSVATGPVTETTFWYVNGGKAYGSGHVQAPSYTFHGSFALRPGDTVDMANEFTFECGPDATCHGTLYSSYYVVS